MLTEANCRFWAGPDRLLDAARAWAYDLTYYFKRGVGERPEVLAYTSEAEWQVHDGYYGPGWYDKALGLYLNFWPYGGRSPEPLTIYVVQGLMTTTHPGDVQPVSYFDKGAAWCLDYSLSQDRQKVLRETMSGPRYDGRDGGPA